MSVQRYVFRYSPKPASHYEANIQSWRSMGYDVSRRDSAAEAQSWNDNFAGKYEKEGGGFTSELSEAKLIGWRSKRFANRTDGELIPARIVIEA